MRPAVREAVAAALSSSVSDIRPLAGGDINDAYRAQLADGRAVFVKTHARADPRMFSCEARGLRWLAQADALVVPEVLAVSEPGPGPQFLALSYIAAGRPATDHDEQLGRGLATLHQSLDPSRPDLDEERPVADRGAHRFGLDHDNFIATLKQDNQPMVSWSQFYQQRRLLPLAERAVRMGLAPASWRPRFDALGARLDQLCGPPEPPARLHGDLWNGNVHTDEHGQPCLIDPAVYRGHREIDLAMLALFGGLNQRIRDAYDERYPLAPGHRERVPLYQLYPLLVHVNLFGGSYVGSVARVLDHYLG